MGNAIPKTVAVVGAGTMGSGIAQKLAQEGLATILLDVNEPALERGMARIGASLDEAVARRIIRPEAKAQILARIRPTTRREDLAEADLVIEAVFEDLEVKRELFAALGTICPPATVLATNTSSFYVRELAEVTAHPERVLGLHYFYHPAKNRLVEVVPHEGTSPEALRRAWLLQERIGKTPIRSADRPGFVVNRYFVPWLNEAVRLLEEDVADLPTIEHVAKQVFGVGMGPFELMNVTGVPIALHAARTLGRELGALYAPSARLAAQVETGEPWPLEGEPGERGAAEVRERMLGIVFHVAAELVDEGVATIENTDIGARVGLRWPKGPFERINEIGVSEALRLAEAAASRYGAAVPALLREQAQRGAPFPIELVRLEVDERGTATLTLNRPDALNALNPALMQQLAERFAQASAREDVRAIVLRGAGKAFVAGADVRWFVERIEAGEIGEIIEFTARGHALLRAIREAAVPVIAVLDGLSLGGGS
ncbi:MAG: 3-hydroxyacyl-CoA dehydrogenase/enoyl-CoA hydratase family protein, partial [Planctomycetota bacterium]